VSRRTYDSSGRRSAASRTQERVVRAATDLMVRRGYAATTVAEVARAAGVSVPLVYAAFGNKAGLLKRVLDVAIVGDLAPVALRDRPEVAEIRSSRTARAQCELNAQLIAAVQARVSGLYPVLVEAAAADPQIAALAERSDEGRREGMAQFVSVLRAAGHLRSDVDPEHATDIVWALTDPHLYRRLVTKRGWAAADYQRWLAEAIYDAVATERPRGGGPLAQQ
jgi:AcrR family transcriptional regulator